MTSYPPPPPSSGDPNQNPWGTPPGTPPGAYPPPPPGYGYPPPPPAGYGYPPPPGYGTPPPGYGTPPPGFGYGEPPAPIPGGRRASMWRRLGGLIIDGILLNIVSGILSAIFIRNSSLGAGVLDIVIWLGYYALLVGRYGASVGHRAVGLRVVDVNTGGLIGPWRAILREIVLVLTGLLLTLGYWSPFFDSQRRQGWHDKATNAVVIPA